MQARRAAALLARGAAASALRRAFASPATAPAAPRRWPLAAAAAAAAAAALACAPSPALALRGGPSGDPDAAFSSLEDSAAPSEAQLGALHAWLAASGADVAGVAVAPCGGAGLGVVCTAPAPALGWLPRALRPAFWLRAPGRTLAEFPLAAALSARSVCLEPACGPLYARWQAEGALSDREAVMLFLLVERARGPASAWAPYLACLPSRPPGPVCWRPEEVAALRGTPAAEALAAQRRALAAALPRLAPLAQQALEAAGVRGAAPLSVADVAWASGIFWSRALALPDLQALREGRARGRDAPAPPLQEAIVPGLDFCNHAAAAPATWTLLGPRAAVHGKADAHSALPTTVALQERGCGATPLRPGAEVRISYGGGRGSEEMLFGYGFVPDDDVADALMLAPPLPPPSASFDAPNAARLALLHAAGRQPRAFLPLRALRQRADRDARAAMEDALHMLLPFSMSELELAAALEALPAEGAPPPDAAAAAPLAHGASRRGALLLAVALLEHRCAALGATGSAAEDDVALAATGEAVAPRLRAAMLYRRAQKRCSQGYLQLAKTMLREEMARPL